MGLNIDGVEFRGVPREMLHDQPFVEGQQKLHIDIPGEANNLIVTATTPQEGMVGIARLDYRPGAWLGKVVVGVDPELNGQSADVIEGMTSKLKQGARRYGMTALEVYRRVEREPGDGLGPIGENPYGDKPIMRIGL